MSDVTEATRLKWGVAMLVALGVSACGEQSGPAPDASLPDRQTSSSPEPDVTWHDATAELGVDFVHRAGLGEDDSDENYAMPAIMGGGIAVFDADGDGALDLYFVSSDGSNRFLHQTSEGQFVDSTEESGLGHQGYGMGSAVADIDNDGDLDVFVTNRGSNALFLNNGSGRFREASSEAGLLGEGWSTSAAFLDYDRDGWLDLFVARYVRFDRQRVCRGDAGRRDFCGPAQFAGQSDLLYRNLGNGRFENVSRAAGIAGLEDAGLGVVAADFDDDGWIDLYVANDSDPNHLWLNQRDGTFVEEAILVGLAFNRYGVGEAGMGVAAGDVDADGDLDLFVTHLIQETNTLYENRGTAGFEDATAAAGLALPSVLYTSFGVALFDYDNDGDLDLAVANGGVKRRPRTSASEVGSFVSDYAEPNQLFRNVGRGKFVEVSSSAGALTEAVDLSRAMVPVDLDGDGDLDLVLTNLEGKVRVVRNEGVASESASRRWVTLELVDPRYRREALGARVQVFAGDAQYLRYALPPGGYLTGAEADIHVGLGSVSRIDRVLIRWPDGLEEEHDGFAAGRRVVLERGRGRTLGGSNVTGL